LSFGTLSKLAERLMPEVPAVTHIPGVLVTMNVV
jgi:hypothetical protein